MDNTVTTSLPKIPKDSDLERLSHDDNDASSQATIVEQEICTSTGCFGISVHAILDKTWSFHPASNVMILSKSRLNLPRSW